MGDSQSKWGVLVDDRAQDYFRDLVQYKNNGSKRNKLGEAADEACRVWLAYQFNENPGLYTEFVNLEPDLHEWLDEEIDEEELREMISPYLEEIQVEGNDISGEYGNGTGQISEPSTSIEENSPIGNLLSKKLNQGRYDEVIEDIVLAYELDEEDVTELLDPLYDFLEE